MTTKKTKIEFLEDVHTYVYDGVIIPSVSDIIRFHFPDAYKGIPESVLKKKATYGTKVHQTIEAFVRKEITMEEIQAKKMDPNIKIAVEQFETLRKKWAFLVKDMEQIVTYKGRYAGTYDIRTIDDCIIDLKTTAELHEDWLALQLGLYQLGAGIANEHAYCIWLPKGKAGSVKQITVTPPEVCLKILDEYEEHTSRQEGVSDLR